MKNQGDANQAESGGHEREESEEVDSFDTKLEKEFHEFIGDPTPSEGEAPLP